METKKIVGKSGIVLVIALMMVVLLTPIVLTATETMTADSIIEYDPNRDGAPRSTGMSAINFEFEHYSIHSTVTDQIEPGSRMATYTIEEELVRLLPTLQGGY